MKFITLVKVFLITLLSYNIFVKSVRNEDTSKKSKGEYKLLFVYYNTSNKDQSHPLNKFDYKNIVLNNDQVVVFVSNAPTLAADDSDYQTTNYLYTMKYINIDLPCLGKSYICTHAEFVREYKSKYPEIVTIVFSFYKFRFLRKFRKEWETLERLQKTV